MREKSCKGRDPSSTPKGPKNTSRRACEHINHPRKEVNETRADAKERTNITGFWSGGGIWSTYDQYEQQKDAGCAPREWQTGPFARDEQQTSYLRLPDDNRSWGVSGHGDCTAKCSHMTQNGHVLAT